MVSFRIFCSPFGVHSACRLQLIFMVCATCFHGVCRFQVSGISSFRRFQTIFYNVLCRHFFFFFPTRVSLLGFLSLYSAYPFQAGLFMVFSAPNLVFVVCVTFSLVFGIFCSYLFSMSLLPFGIVFHGVLLLLSSCAARHFGLVFHIFYTLRSVFLLYIRISCCLPRFLFMFVVAYVFFSSTSSSIRKFSSLFLCLFANVIKVKTLVFSSLFPRALLFSRLLFTWHF